jgi:hypothetical protein
MFLAVLTCPACLSMAKMRQMLVIPTRLILCFTLSCPLAQFLAEMSCSGRERGPLDQSIASCSGRDSSSSKMLTEKLGMEGSVSLLPIRANRRGFSNVFSCLKVNYHIHCTNSQFRLLGFKMRFHNNRSLFLTFKVYCPDFISSPVPADR